MNSIGIAMNEPGNRDQSTQYKGWLYKWTNYLRGYQKRWFVLQNGLLSYYRNHAEMSHTCRGTINLASAQILPYDSCTFIIKNSGTQVFHLKAPSEVDRQRWVTALELAKSKAPAIRDADSCSEDGEITMGTDSREVEQLIAQIDQKLSDMKNFSATLNHNGETLIHLLAEFEAKRCEAAAALPVSSAEDTLVKSLKERTTMHKIMLNAMLNSCRDVGEFLSNEGRRWKRLLDYERGQRRQLQDMVEQLAKQHSSLEKKIIQEGSCGAHPGFVESAKQQQHRATSASSAGAADEPGASKASQQPAEDEDNSEDEFHDANEMLELEGGAGVDSAAVVNSQKQQKQEQQQIIKISLPTNRTPSPAVVHKTDSFADEYESDCEYSDREAPGDSCEYNVIMTKLTRHASSGSSAGQPKLRQHQRPLSRPSSSVGFSQQHPSSSSSASLTGGGVVRRTRRSTVPERPNYSLNLWSIMKNCIGRELTKIPMPVNFSEPLSMLQRITEELEYSHCLDKAARASDQWEQLAYVAAYTISSYSTTAARTAKPFNPLLGETFEFDRTEDLGWRSFAEQVSHHPPAAAFHVESKAGWIAYQEFGMSSKFRGKFLSVIPHGIAHLVFAESGHHYTWRKVTSTVHNIIVGKLWIDNHGEMDIVNHTTGDVCRLTYKPYSYFSRETPRKVTGVITDRQGVTRYVLTGTWDEMIEGARVCRVDDANQAKPVMETRQASVLWRRNPNLPNADKMYNFTKFAIEMNEPEDGVAPTDSRLRPDQRLMEDGRWDEANKEKLRLEEKQRAKRRQREVTVAAAADADSTVAAGGSTGAAAGQLEHGAPEFEPVWFKLQQDEITGNSIHRFTGDYWACKERADWSKCPDLY
uniref:Oxysterol-binding protein n=1 Tax=Macrostomum lignano TaxID=282301 RepID=A0A1I8H0G0_9PLAT